MGKKKILFIHTSTKISGAETSLMNSLYNMSTSKYILHIILPDKNDLYHKLNNQFNVSIFKVYKIHNSLNLLYILRSLIKIIIQSIKIACYIKKHNIDIIYSNSMYSQVYCIFIKLFSNTKLIWHVRDNVSRKMSVLFPLILCNKVICVSNYISEQIKYSSKKQTIYNGLNINEWVTVKNCEENLKKKLNLNNDFKLIAQIGQLVKWKNHKDFIYAAKSIITKYKKVHFLFIGSDLFGNNSDYLQSLKRLITQEGLDDYMTFLGYIENVKLVIQQVDILIHTALNEPFGRVLIEAMAMEKPVIAYNVGGPSEIIKHEKNGFLIDPEKHMNIANKSIQLLNDRQLCEKIGRKARETVASNFNIQHSTIELESIIDNLS